MPKTAKRAQGTGSIYRQPGTENWTIQYYSNGRRVREATGTASRQRAQELLSTRLASVAKGEPLDQCRPVKVQALYEHLVQHNKVNGRATRTASWTLHLAPYFAAVLATRINAQMLLDYRARRQQAGAAVGTINRELGVLRRLLRVAYQDNLLIRVPHICMPAEDNVRTGFLTDAQLDQLRDAADKVGLWMRTMVELSAGAYAWRKREMLDLRVRQVDFAAGTIRLETGTTKNKAGREVPLTSATRPLLEACCAGKRADDYVLTRGRPPVRIADPRDAWHTMCIQLGMGAWHCMTKDCATVQPRQGRCPKCKARNWRYEGLLIHDMRRTGVRNLRRAGVSEQVAMSISGHKTASTFRRYDIVCNDDKVDALAALQRAQQRSRATRVARAARQASDTKAAIIATPGSSRVQ